MNMELNCTLMIQIVVKFKYSAVQYEGEVDLFSYFTVFYQRQ